jgi:ABC-type nitrate/sulfonate/bicarbonate transport system permease component
MRAPKFPAPLVVVALCLASPANADPVQSAIAQVPARAVGTVLGAAIGTPIALVRCTKRELVKQTKECFTLGGVPKPLGYVTAAAFGIPSGIICGAWYGAADGIADGVANSKDSPFNKGVFSLDKLSF